MSHLREHWAENGLLWLSASQLNAGGAVHGFSTRLGGVSRGCLASLNWDRSGRVRLPSVRENFRRFGDAVGLTAGKQ